MKTKQLEDLSLNHAIDNLSIISDLPVTVNSTIGLVQESRFVLQSDDFLENHVEWLSPINVEEILDVMDKTYEVILNYLEDLYDDPNTKWSDYKTVNGLQALMVLVGEAAFRLDAYLSLFNVKEQAADLYHFKEVQKFFIQKINEKIPDGLEGRGSWRKEWTENDEKDLIDFNDRGLKDFETVKKDQEYELFYIKNEDEKPFFTLSLLRNIKLVCDFDESIREKEDDPFIEIHKIHDKDLQRAAKYILKKLYPEMKKFYEKNIDFKANDLAGTISKSFIALFMAANPANLKENNNTKTSLDYFHDFHLFLRSAFHCKEYEKISIQKEKTLLSTFLFNLLHQVCFEFFTRFSFIKEEMTGMIYRMIHKGETNHFSEDFWQHFFENEDRIRTTLEKVPNHPLFKDLEVIRQNKDLSFDPIMQKNYPFKYFNFTVNQKEIGILHLPCPTEQSVLSDASIIDEYKGFLEALPPKNHLMINLQDRISWKERTRSLLMEKFQDHKENLVVVTFPVQDYFYEEIKEYAEINEMKKFKDQFLDEIHSDRFFFPEGIRKQMLCFMEECINHVGEYYFPSQTVLSKNLKQDFIHLVYFFSFLKLIDLLDVDYLSFTSKDGIDKGATFTAGFFAFLHILKNQKMEKEMEEKLLYLFYSVSLIVRERAIDPVSFHKILSVIAFMDKKTTDTIRQNFEKMFSKNLFSNISI